eukprot:TRINITY_DN2213_c0_g1_i1.p1 TRINITY_DN2213_c0_g1~~TRINITY_DN2213_c0_g1_i1.p1  ORF type:complete len:423 (+),score=85.02 TRINITY_DN2213_c0_g1_i1:187-1455(+)
MASKPSLSPVNASGTERCNAGEISPRTPVCPDLEEPPIMKASSCPVRCPDSMNVTDDSRVNELRPIIAPAVLLEDIPLTPSAERVVTAARRAASEIINGKDDRMIALVGPCSIHNPSEAIEYGKRLRSLAAEVQNDVMVVMRVYFEKPRTTVGWKGLINDPSLDGTFKINTGVRIARSLLADLNEMGLPAGVEFLDNLSPQYIADLVTWGAIGARTTESQIHRELASGLSCPVGFKNGTDGAVGVASDAVVAARHRHHFLGMTKQGLAAIVGTNGNPDCHVILRGGTRTGPNYNAEHVATATAALAKAGIETGLMVDCSHGNSEKDYRRQARVLDVVADQVAAGNTTLRGVMIESNLESGSQPIPKLPKGSCVRSALKPGISVTDGCVDWETTVTMVHRLAKAVEARRLVSGGGTGTSILLS